MGTFVWPAEDGWPYPDSLPEAADLSADPDDDLVWLRSSTSVLDRLDPLERQVIAMHYGLNGHQPRSMKELHGELGLPRAQLRDVLGSGLTKLRTQFGS